MEALQHLRVKQRWEELDKENTALEEAKKSGLKYKLTLLSNGDTPKQLLDGNIAHQGNCRLRIG
jgi:transposase